MFLFIMMYSYSKKNFSPLTIDHLNVEIAKTIQVWLPIASVLVQVFKGLEYFHC